MDYGSLLAAMLDRLGERVRVCVIAGCGSNRRLPCI